jgi:hypothetical protein
MLNSNIISLIISGGVSILTIFGVRLVDSYTKGREQVNRLQGKEFDDGVERRKELIREIEAQRKIIEAKDIAIAEHLVRIEALKDKVSQDAIRYIVLANKYEDVVNELSRFSTEMAERFKLSNN